MSENKWRSTADKLKEKLSFLKVGEELDDEDGDWQAGETSQTTEDTLPAGELTQKPAWSRKRKMHRGLFLFLLAAAAAGGFFLYNQFYVFRDYTIAESKKIEISAGTQYESVGKKLYRYNSDGVSCISRKNEMQWSVTYSMQAPIADVCGSTMAIAEQQGTQVYVVGKDGLIGNFETQAPILKVRVSEQGIVALVLQEEKVTWINLYRPDGTPIANDKTTVGETGYPLDVALAPNGQKMMVSYLGVWDGVMTDRIVFYHFGTEGQNKQNNIVNSIDYPQTVIPQVYFMDNATAAAVADTGFYVYRGKDKPQQSAEVSFEQEIISSFHDNERIGFLFMDEEGEKEYRVELYNYKGKRKGSRNIDARFDHIKMENGRILMYNDKGFDVFFESGRPHFSSAYEEEVEDIFYFGEFRKYLVITKDSFDKIRIS